MKPWFSLLMLSMAAQSATALEHPACQSRGLDLQQFSVVQLRLIAASCNAPSTTRLFYNRAYHADLVAESEGLRNMIEFYNTDRVERFDAYRLYLGMAEQMALVWYPEPAAQVAFLNREYERVNELAELRLRGFDHRADHLEQQAQAAHPSDRRTN